MKLIDFAIVFFVVFISVISILHFKNDMIYRNKLNSMMFNDAVDEIVVDALSISFYVRDDEIEINKDQLMECYQNELSILCSGTNILKDYVNNRCICILTEGNGFYIYDNGIWSEKILYDTKGNTLEGGIVDSDNRVHIIATTLKEEYDITLLLSSNEGETFKNTLDKYSFVVIYTGREYRFADSKYQIVFVSGASIKNLDETS